MPTILWILFGSALLYWRNTMEYDIDLKCFVAEGSENLSYIGNCTDDDVIEHIFGDATNFAQVVEEHGDEFTIDDLVVKYDPESDIHSFYYKKQGVAEGSEDTIYPNAEVIKSKNGKPVGEIYQDGNYWGAFHYRADRGYDFIDSREKAIEVLKDLHQETGRSRPDYIIKGVAD